MYSKNRLNLSAILLIKLYKRLLSPLLGRSCRYYPSCSEYGYWQFENRNFFLALVATLCRIVRCNPLFSGGIEYPLVQRDDLNRFSSLLKPISNENRTIIYWLIPKVGSKNRFFIVKKF